MTEKIIEKLNAKFPSVLKEDTNFRDETTLRIDADHVRDVASFLRNDEDAQYDLLVDVYGTDRLKLGQSPRFAVNYELYSIPKNNFIRLIAEASDPGQNGNGSSSSGKFGEALPKVA